MKYDVNPLTKAQTCLPVRQVISYYRWRAGQFRVREGIDGSVIERLAIMRHVARYLIAGLTSATLLTAQTLHVPLSHATHGTPASFSIVFDSPHDKAPAAIQWEISFPQAIEVDTSDIISGSAAESAGKSITCSKTAARTEAKGGVKFACILAGGQRPIGNGPIAVIHFVLQADVQGAPIRAPIENILGVTADLKRIAISNVDAIITTR